MHSKFLTFGTYKMSELNEVLKLILVIFLPPLLSFLLVKTVFFWKINIRAKLTLCPENGLIKQALLWHSIIIPFIYFIVLSS